MGKLNERANKIRAVERECKKQIWSINFNETKLEKEKENDDGHGYLKCHIDINKLKEWRNPCNIQIKMTSNGIMYSDLYSIQSINPEIKEIRPKMGLFSDTTEIKMFIDGFDLNNTDKDDMGISINDVEETMVDIEQFQIETDENSNSFVVFNAPPFSKDGHGEKKINLKYKDLFEIETVFLAHNIIKIASIEPKIFTISEGGEMKIEFGNELDLKYFDP